MQPGMKEMVAGQNLSFSSKMSGSAGHLFLLNRELSNRQRRFRHIHASARRPAGQILSCSGGLSGCVGQSFLLNYRMSNRQRRFRHFQASARRPAGQILSCSGGLSGCVGQSFLLNCRMSGRQLQSHQSPALQSVRQAAPIPATIRFPPAATPLRRTGRTGRAGPVPDIADPYRTLSIHSKKDCEA